MHIVISSNGEVDFKAPVYMSDEQYKRFLKFIGDLVKGIGTEEVIEKKRGKGEGENRKLKKWTTSEYLLLLSSDSNKTLESKLGRSDMSIIHKRGEFMQKYFAWAKKKGHVIKKDDLSIRKQFLKEAGYL